MKVVVLNQHFIEKTYKNIKDDCVVISITSTTAKSIKANISTTYNVKDILFLVFDDVCGKIDELELKLFNKDMAKQILDFVDKHSDKLIICQCEAGISRSAGVAAALSKIYNGTDDFFFKRYIPNNLVYKTILELNYANCESR